MVESHDSVVQITNYANFLIFREQYQKSYDALIKLAGYLERGNPVSDDHARVMQSLAMLCMASGHKAQGQAYLRRAAEIYESIYAFAPEVLEEKRQELQRI